MFQHILVPLDFTRKNASALKVATTLAKQNRSRVTLLHVIETIDYADDEEIAEFYESLKIKAKALMASHAQRMEDAGVTTVEVKLVMGRRGRGIVSYAIQRKVDLVVLSSHKVRLEKAPKGWATLSYQVSILCPCPVLLVK